MTPNIFPVLRYADARAGIDWLVRAFGFESVEEHAWAGGSIAHAELRLGTGLISLGTAGAPVEGNPWTAARHGVYVAVGDVDAHYARAEAAGAEIAMPLHDTSYGSRDYSVRDMAGHLWGFGTYTMSAEEGEPNIFPELRYGSPEALGWLAKAFGFEPTAQIPGADGTIVHAEMRLGDGTIMVSLGPESQGWGGLNQATSVRVDDPDAHYARAKAAGAAIVYEPWTTHYGARSYWARDREGFLWGFSTYRPA